MNYNVYCDESCHMLHSQDRYMILGCIWCPKDSAKYHNKRIREIKEQYKFPPNEELKWTKISKTNTKVYESIVDYFFNAKDISFRAIVIDKNELEHSNYDQSHETWYYKMMFQLIHVLLSSNDEYSIYLDYKDTQSGTRSRKLMEVLRNYQYDFNGDMIKTVQCLPSHEIGLIQMCDILIGAIAYEKRGLTQNYGKSKIVDLLKTRSGKNLKMSTLPFERKFNLFIWHGGKTQ